MQRNIDIRPVIMDDFSALQSLLSLSFHTHRHLDWRSPQDWLGHQPFWVLTEGEKLLAALACPSDPPELNWIRLFIASPFVNHNEAWKLLFSKVIENLLPEQQNLMIAAVSLKDWFTELLTANGFMHFQDIVVLELKSQPTRRRIDPDIHIRIMQKADLETVKKIDHASFEPLWRNSLDGIQHSFDQSAYATVAVLNGKVVGYQICTQSPFSAHLARLAVLPGNQRKGIGYALVYDLIEYFTANKIYQISVNTQNNNFSSLSLYEKIGFSRTDESFPVYIYKDAQ